MPLVFKKASSIKCALFWHLFFWIILFRFKPANRKSTFIELTDFKILFLVNFQISALNESYHFLVKLACKGVCTGESNGQNTESWLRFKYFAENPVSGHDCNFLNHTFTVTSWTRTFTDRCHQQPPKSQKWRNATERFHRRHAAGVDKRTATREKFNKQTKSQFQPRLATAQCKSAFTRFWWTQTRVQSNPSNEFALRQRLPQ